MICYIYYYFIIFSECDLTFKHVSAIEQEVWAVTSDGVLQRRLGITADNVVGSAWQSVLSGSLVHVSARGGCLQ